MLKNDTSLHPMRSSISEDHGIALLSNEDLRIYSVGVSTGGVAEIRMAQAHSKRHIIATTIDPDGALFAGERIQQLGLEQRIKVRIENVAQPLPYPNEQFDFIYARLILHYLPKLDLISALNELCRVLRPKGQIFIVVRSDKCLEAHRQHSIFNPETGMTTYTSNGHSFSRYFHNEQSLENYLRSAGFQIKH